MAAENDTRQRRLFKNGAYSLLSWLVPLIPTFVVTPIVVKGLGNEIYGVYVVILGFISYFFTFGIGKAAAKYVAEYRASGETEKISDIISSTIILSGILGAIGTIGIAFFAPFIVADVLLISEPLQNTAVVALYLACANILLSMMSQIFQFVLQGLQRFDRFLLLTNLNSLFISIGSVGLVLNGFGILALLYWTLFAAIVVGILSFLTARKLLPEFTFRITVSREAWNSVWRYSLSIIAYQVFGNLLLLFERGWIMRKFGAEALTYYVVPMTLGMYIHLFTSSLVLALFPMFNELLGEKEKLVILYKKSTKLILTLVAFALVSAIVCGRMFLGIWMNEEFSSISYSLLVIHVITFSLLAMMTIVWQVAESFRFAGLNAVVTLAWMVIAVPLMAVLSSGFNTQGIALARGLGVLVFIPMLLFVEKRFLGGVFWGFWAGTLSRVCFAAAVAATVEWALMHYFTGRWLLFLVSITVGFAAYCFTLIAVGYFEKEDRTILRGILFKS